MSFTYVSISTASLPETTPRDMASRGTASVGVSDGLDVSLRCGDDPAPSRGLRGAATEPARSGARCHQSGAILEVGCGSGNLLLQIAKAYPNSRCTGVDIDPTGLAVAREAVKKARLTERVQILEGDVRSAVEPETYEVVVMVEVLHEISPALRPGVLRGCARALRIGGWLVIVDETYPSTLAEARRPEFLFPVQTAFEELLWGNVVPTKEQQEQLLRQAGFTGMPNRALMGEASHCLRPRSDGVAYHAEC